MQLPPSVHALQFHTAVTLLTPKGEISDHFHNSTVLSVVYLFSNFKHEICKKNLNQKKCIEACLKRYAVNNCLESAGAGSVTCKHHGPAAVHPRALCTARSRADLAHRFPNDGGSGWEEGAGSTLPCHHHQPPRESGLV